MASSTSADALIALTSAWQQAWADFLSNRIVLAERRAAPFLHSLPEKVAAAAAPVAAAAAPGAADDDERLADELVMLGDLAHLAGAVRDDAPLLRSALAAYDAHLARIPLNLAAMRMRAETLLRVREYVAAFAAFGALYEANLRAAKEDEIAADAAAEVAPFQLRHDAECIEDAVRLGADAASLGRAASWRTLAEDLQREAAGEATHRWAVSGLSEARRALLGAHGLPLPTPPSASASLPPTRALRADLDWAWASSEYATQRHVVIDDLLEPLALATLQAYTRHGAHFRTLRKGYLGAFPADGTTHPLLLSLAQELTESAPTIFGAHALALWWIFKYDSHSNPHGIGIHADPAAVNMNLWLTDDAACVEGGGLAIYSHVPPLEQPTQGVNHEFGSDGAEASLRQTLVAAGTVRTVAYRCNRAAVFVSDQYHESLPFSFREGYEQRRANLTLLFGDRWSHTEPAAAIASSAGPAAAASDFFGAGVATSTDDGFDVFD